MDDGELGFAVFDGTMSPPGGAPLSENLRVKEQQSIAEVLDAYIEDLEENGFNDLELLGQMTPPLKRLIICPQIAASFPLGQTLRGLMDNHLQWSPRSATSVTDPRTDTSGEKSHRQDAP